jgi:hypothetical protein
MITKLAYPSYVRDLAGRSRGNIVWREHTEGFATIAYRDGHAIAGISGPWSHQYVLIWWQPSQPVHEVEVFDSLEDAKRAVARSNTPPAGTHLDALLANLRRDIALPRPSWLRRVTAGLVHLWQRRSSRTQHYFDRAWRTTDEHETDLTGLDFRAMR